MKETARLEAFSDGVFAIAITLLVLELKVPEIESKTNAALWQALGAQWPSYLAYLSSFFTILIIWVNHHRLFNLVHRTNRGFMYLNGLLLLLVTTIPFPTALLADYILTDAAAVACAIYTSLYLLLALIFNWLWYYSLRHELITKSNANFQGVRRGYLLGPFLYGAAVLLSFFMPLLSVLICLAMAVYFAILDYEIKVGIN